MDKELLKKYVEYLIREEFITDNFTGTHTLTISFKSGGIRDIRHKVERVFAQK